MSSKQCGKSLGMMKLLGVPDGYNIVNTPNRTDLYTLKG